eukprot:gene13635-15022_t
MSCFVTVLSLLFMLSCVSSAYSIAIFPSFKLIYNESPEIVVEGSGFLVNPDAIFLDIGSADCSHLIMDFDFTMNINEGGSALTLNLVSGHHWVTTLNFTSRNPPISLILYSVKFGSAQSTNLLETPVPIALITASPTVNANLTHIYQNQTAFLSISGTGWLGASKVMVRFNPRLMKNFEYEDISTYPLQGNQVTLRLRPNHFWREDPGPLIVTTVDTGGGPVQVNGTEGVIVAYVDRNPGAESEVFVLDTSGSQVIYNEEEFVIISGGGFNPEGTEIEFLDEFDLRTNVNYSIESVSKTEIRVKRLSGSSWLHFRPGSGDYLQPLIVHTVDRGVGAIRVGNPGMKGKSIAKVLEQPGIDPSNTKIYMNLTSELRVQGRGFPSRGSGFLPQLRLSPPLIEGLDYNLGLYSDQRIKLTLRPNRVFRKDAGPLIVTAINTKGDDKGWISLGENGIQIGIVEYTCFNNPNRVFIQYNPENYIYQTRLDQPLIVHGERLDQIANIEFYPALTLNQDYYIQAMNSTRLVLKLKESKKWLQRPGRLYIQRITSSDGTVFCYTVGSNRDLNGDGIEIAHILSDPIVAENFTQVIHESQTKILYIHGRGFSNSRLTNMFLRPVRPKCWSLLSVEETLIRVRLVEGCAWVPSIESLKDKGDDALIYIQVHSMDSGAGEIIDDDGITVGIIKRDIPGLVCNDSCVTSLDGYCEDGSDPYVPYEKIIEYPCSIDTDCTDCGGVEVIQRRQHRDHPSPNPTPNPSNSRSNNVSVDNWNSDSISPSSSPTIRVLPPYIPTTTSNNDPNNFDSSTDLLKIGLLLVGCGLLVFGVIKLSQVCFERGPETTLRGASAVRYQPVSSVSDEDDVEMSQSRSGRHRNVNDCY